MTRPFALRPLAAALAVLVLLAGCDAGTDTPVDTSATAQTDTEDAARNVAAALALDGGGVLEDAAAAAAVAAESVPGVSPDGHPPFPPRPGCTPARTFDAAAVLYTLTTSCTRTNDATGVSAVFARVATVQFLGDGGQPQPERQGAAALSFDILSGTSTVTTPRRSHRLLSLTASFDVTDLGQDLVTVNGTYARAATDTLTTPRGGQRTLTHELALTLTDVRGPRGVRADWHRAVSGTIAGTYHAVRTATGRDGATTTREVTRTFTVTLGGNSDVAEIAVGGQTFRADRRTGDVSGIE